MITCLPIGGVANEMFIISACIGTAERLGVDWFVPVTWERGHYFKGSFNYIDLPILPQYKEPCYHYQPIERDNVTLSGYFQSYKYWENCETLIKALFKPSNELYDKINNKYGDLFKLNTCALHVRRDDYLNLSAFHTNLTLDYYKEAISMMGDKTLVVFSNDIEWCKKNIIIADEFIQEGDGQRGEGDMLDFFIMSQMKSFIIANSSFSWWASYLSGSKDIIAPQAWFGPKRQMNDTKDLYLPQMKVI